MDLTLILLVVVVVLLAVAVSAVLSQKDQMRKQVGEVRELREKVATELDRARIDALTQAQQQGDRLGESLRGLTETVQKRLESQQELLTRQLGDSGRTVADLKKELGSLSEATGRFIDIGKDISRLQDILQSPKLRGGMGEVLLENLLAQIFPRSFFEVQYAFSGGVTVDAVVRIGERLVPIDSKFPIDDFRRVLEAEEPDRARARRQFLANVRKRVDEIASKYILPDQGTFDFALMYIPAENVYYETIIREEESVTGSGLSEMLGYAVSRRVVPVSPNTFYAYLQVILYGLKGMQLEQKGAEILGHLHRLRGEVEKFEEEYNKLGTHLDNARGAYERGGKKLAGLESQLGEGSGTPELPAGERMGERAAEALSFNT
jgi:DNA recombination protein RmuC